MAILVPGGMDAFATSIYGAPHPTTLDFIQRKIYAATDQLTSAGQQFMSNVHQLYEQFSGHDAVRLLRAAGRAAAHMFQTDTVRYLGSISDLQFAPPTMQRYIMADPTIRQLYYDNRVDGYSHSYVDMHPGDIGDQHYDYRRVMNGVVVFDEDGGWHARTWNEALEGDDYELSMNERNDILGSMWAARQFIKAGGEDPLSIYGSPLE